MIKAYNQILEAIQKGINIALDDYEDELILTLKSNIIEDKNLTKDLIDFYNSFVDLGLPSGTLWAKYNLGTNWNKLYNNPENSTYSEWYGKTWAWGELEPKDSGNWDNYKFGNEEHKKFKYNIQDGLDELLPEDDAAYLYDNRFRMPTYALCKELSDNTHSILIKNYNPNLKYPIEGDNHGIDKLNGVAIISNINRNHIFVPYAYSSYAFFWSSTLTKKQPACNTACFLNMDGWWNHGHCYTANSDRCNNKPIRPILNRN